MAIGFVDHRVARSFGVRTRITLRGTLCGHERHRTGNRKPTPPRAGHRGRALQADVDVWACFAAPVADPITGQMAGLVNITCRAESANHFLAVALRSLTDRIGVALRDAAAPRQHRLLEACLRFRASTRRAVVALDRTLLLADDRAASFHLDRAQVWSAIVEAGPYARMVTLPGGLTAELYPVAPRSLSHGGVVLVLGPNTGSRTLPDSGGGDRTTY